MSSSNVTIITNETASSLGLSVGSSATPSPSYSPTGRWVLDEDEALKSKLSGFTVTNYVDDRKMPIAVYFRFPDPEERTRTFPHIVIDLVEINYDRTRSHHAEQYVLDYPLDQATPPTGFSLVADDYPMPWSLVYQLTAYSRQPVHDRQILMMMYQLFPQMYGSLDMTDYDGTIRRADLESVTRRDTIDSENKRIYRNIFTVAISSEFFLNQVLAIQQATSVNVYLNTM